MKKNDRLLIESIYKGNLVGIRDAMSQGADIHVRDDFPGGKKGTVLHSALASSDHFVVDCLCSNSADVNALDIEGDTPMHILSSRHDFESKKILDVMMKYHPDLSIENNKKRTPFAQGAYSGNIAFCESLVTHGYVPSNLDLAYIKNAQERKNLEIILGIIQSKKERERNAEEKRAARKMRKQEQEKEAQKLKEEGIKKELNKQYKKSKEGTSDKNNSEELKKIKAKEPEKIKTEDLERLKAEELKKLKAKELKRLKAETLEKFKAEESEKREKYKKKA